MGRVKLTGLSLSLALMIGLSGCTNSPAAPAHSPRTIERTPAPPSNLSAEAVSYDVVVLQWIDNSENEEGFRIYRDNQLIETLYLNLTNYQDIGLKPATNYSYTIKAYNATGESQGCSTDVRTPNPPVTVTLDRIGVYDNREDRTRGTDGEVYLYIVVSDGKKTTEQMRFPPQGQYYKLEKNETVDIGAIIFSADEVGDSLTLAIIGYEDDGGGIEPLLYKALGAAIESGIAGGAGGLLEAFDFSVGGLIARFFGAEDDWLGSYRQTWNQGNNWGIGRYSDIPLEDERGVQCLRLWFSILWFRVMRP